MRRLPIKILKEPWIDSTVEIKFDSSIDRSAVFGVIYYALRDTYSKVEELPILQLPEVAIDSNPEMAGQPRYRILSPNFYLQIGPGILSVHCNGDYQGWAKYSQEIFRILNVVKNLSIIKNVFRVGVRYINFLPYSNNIFNDLQLKLIFPVRSLDEVPTTIQLILPEENYISRLHVANFTDAIRNNQRAFGSIVDIDTYRTVELDSFFDDFAKVITRAHQIEKSIFFNLFTDEYLESLGPTYYEDKSN